MGVGRCPACVSFSMYVLEKPHVVPLLYSKASRCVSERQHGVKVYEYYSLYKRNNKCNFTKITTSVHHT